MYLNEIRQQLMIDNSIITNETISVIWDYNYDNLSNIKDLTMLLTLYEISRRIRDDLSSKYYRSVILGKLNLAQE